MATLGAKPKFDTVASSSEEGRLEELVKLEQRRTQELVFAMVAPIGSGASTVAALIKKNRC